MSADSKGVAKASSVSLCSPSPVRASWLSASLILPPLAILGELLIERTHHRPLGAATFATIAVILWMLAEIVSRRLLNGELSPSRGHARRIAWGVSLSLNTVILLRSLV